MTRILYFVLGAAIAVGCSSSVDVAKDSRTNTSAPDASPGSHGGSGASTPDGSAGAYGGSSPLAPEGSTSAHDGSTTTIDHWVPTTRPVVDAMICDPVHSTTPSGVCPVMPRGGALCAPPVGPSWPCGSRGMCDYGSSIPERVCPKAVCTDEQGNCPPAETVCVPVQSCTTAADCRGDPPSRECVACPLSPDGTQTVSCSHWVCTDGKCLVGAPCQDRTDLTCRGGHGCPSYYFPRFDKTCGVDADCAVFSHWQSCCSTRVIGVSARDKALADTTEAECEGLLDQFARICGCYSPPVAEDGQSIPFNGQTIVGACIDGSCTAVVRGRVQCGVITCAEGESCCQGPDAKGYCMAFCAASCPATGCMNPP